MSQKTARKRPRREIEDENSIMKVLKEKSEKVSFHMKPSYNLKPKHQEFLRLIQDSRTNMIFVNGPAGTAKTYVGAYGAMLQMKDEKFDGLIYIRSIIESASESIGALPGEVGDKFQPYSMPLIEKLNEIVDHGSIAPLFDNGTIRAIPVNFVRGLTFNKSVVIIDEAQNLTKKELTTILTRFGNKSLYIVCGDTFQNDIKETGFEKVFAAFDTDASRRKGIHCLTFTKHEIVRSEILKFIVEVLETT
jgi:phosphate starvation-inducible PhoH-like protein